MSKKILIIGNSAKAYSLAKNMSKNFEVFVAASSDTMEEFTTCVDIRENSSRELLEFVLENDIDLTIPVSIASLNTDIVELFNANNKQIFAPVQNATKLTFDKAAAKKVLYKLRIPTPKFGIFEKQNMAQDYIKNIKTPFVIKTNESSSAVVLTSQNSAKIILDSMFVQKNQKVLIEDYIYGTPFSFYAITDGYKALPFGSSITYKHSLEGEGGQLTNGMGACSPNYKLSIENEYFLMDNVIYPTLDYFEMEGNPYVGILGINGILTENENIQVLGYQSFMQDCDCDGILSLIDTDLYKLFESCILGSFSDEIDFIPVKDKSTVSIVLNCKTSDNKQNPILGLDLLDEETLISFYSNVNKNKYLEYEAKKGSVAVITASASTVTKACDKVYDEISELSFAGMNYRKDICKTRTTEI